MAICLLRHCNCLSWWSNLLWDNSIWRKTRMVKDGKLWRKQGILPLGLITPSTKMPLYLMHLFFRTQNPTRLSQRTLLTRSQPVKQSCFWIKEKTRCEWKVVKCNTLTRDANRMCVLMMQQKYKPSIKATISLHLLHSQEKGHSRVEFNVPSYVFIIILYDFIERQIAHLVSLL